LQAAAVDVNSNAALSAVAVRDLRVHHVARRVRRVGRNHFEGGAARRDAAAGRQPRALHRLKSGQNCKIYISEQKMFVVKKKFIKCDFESGVFMPMEAKI